MSRNYYKWHEMYQRFVEFKAANGNKPVPQDCVLQDGLNLGQWVCTQRQTYRQGKMLPERVALLTKAGIVWDAFQYMWEQGFMAAQSFYLQNGHLNVLRSENPQLYTWLRTQIGAYRGQRGSLSAKQIHDLEAIGMKWDIIEDDWMAMYSLAQQYFATHQKLNIPVSLSVEDKALGQWLARQRKAYRNYLNGIQGGGKAKMTPERIRLLESIGMEWDVTYLGRKCSFPENAVFYYISKAFPDAAKLNQEDFLGKELDIYIPSIKTAIEYDGYTWHHDKIEVDTEKDTLCTERNISLFRIREPKLPQLESSTCFMLNSTEWVDLETVICAIIKELGKEPPNCNIERDYLLIHESHIQYMSHKWDAVYEFLLQQYNTNGFVGIKLGDKTSAGVDLYNWISKQREAYREKTLCSAHIEKLQSIGVVLDPFEEKWKANYLEAVKYYKEHGDLLVPIGYKANGLNLGKWISHKRDDYKKGRLSPVRVRQLESIGMSWSVCDTIQERNKALLIAFRQEFGDIHIKAKTEYRGFKLGGWIQTIKKANKAGKLSMKDRLFFESMGIDI